MHKSIYYGHLYNNRVTRRCCVQALPNETEMVAVAALREFLMGEEEKGTCCVPMGEAQDFDLLVVAKDIVSGQEIKLSCAPL